MPREIAETEIVATISDAKSSEERLNDRDGTCGETQIRGSNNVEPWKLGKSSISCFHGVELVTDALMVNPDAVTH